jgi:hypothetical protein
MKRARSKAGEMVRVWRFSVKFSDEAKRALAKVPGRYRHGRVQRVSPASFDLLVTIGYNLSITDLTDLYPVAVG